MTDRLKHREGDKVVLRNGNILFVKHVLPAEQSPYILSDGGMYREDDVSFYVAPEPSWSEVEQAIKKKIQEVIDRFSKENIGSFTIDMKASGRVDGDAKIEFTVADNSATYVDSVCKCTGFNLDAAIDEVLRRRTWKDRNEPKALTFSPTPDVDPDEIPY